MSKEESKQPSFFQELIKLSLIVALIVVPIRVFIAQPFIVNGASMRPAFKTGNYLIVDQISYRFENPARGDVVVFKYPKNPSIFFIKRIVGLPGETVKIRDGNIIIVNDKHPNGVKLDSPSYINPENNGRNLTQKLEGNEYFVMGDNRAASLDSRKWGPLAEKFIVGKAFLRLFPFNKMGLMPGYVDIQLQTN